MKNIATLFLVILILIINIGCSEINVTDSKNTRTLSAAKDIIDYERQKKQVVLIDSLMLNQNGLRGVSGSGICISETKVLVNQHVIEDAVDIKITLHDRTIVDGLVLTISKKVDLATIKIPGGCIPAVITTRPVVVGEDVYMIGHLFRMLSWTTHWGKVSSSNIILPDNMQNELGHKGDFFQLDITSAVGASGGPVFRGNEVVGIITVILKDGENTKISGISLAIPVSVICDFIKC